MVVLARSGFAMQHGTRKKEFNPVPQKENSVDSATAASLVSLKSSGKKPMCIFCDKPHASHKCFCAKRLSLDERLKILSKKGACYTCLTKSNHISIVSDLKSRLKCKYCSLSHYEFMCRKKPDTSVSVESSNPSPEISF
ncbi:DUF1758 domain-containing protein [Trichonephila inaurata madagascariensis]|uniref:DUF1758 domain-containing protein n=1 Tax=Trichonephila inaurata madagascariensis TaxID=2747483 RepID=A0A8X6WZD3_9ARAC|nr:DUF1758 domain-containing protein [Trichonephila inaurata madagascariensis]